MIIGVTGGIGSGKSTFEKTVKDLDFSTIDADVIASEILIANDPLKNLIVRFFKAECDVDVLIGGEINKKIIAKWFFTDSKTKKYIEGLIHPLVKTHIENWIEEHSNETVFIFVPIMFETGFNEMMDKVINISSTILNRADRVMKNRNCSFADFHSRVKNQTCEEERCMRSDYVIENNDTIEEFEKNILKIIETINVERKLRDAIGADFVEDFQKETIEFGRCIAEDTNNIETEKTTKKAQ